MGRLAGFLWLALFISFLGWYGWAIIGAWAVLCVVYFFIKCWWDDRKYEKIKKERGW